MAHTFVELRTVLGLGYKRGCAALLGSAVGVEGVRRPLAAHRSEAADGLRCRTLPCKYFEYLIQGPYPVQFLENIFASL